MLFFGFYFVELHSEHDNWIMNDPTQMQISHILNIGVGETFNYLLDFLLQIRFHMTKYRNFKKPIKIKRTDKTFSLIVFCNLQCRMYSVHVRMYVISQMCDNGAVRRHLWPIAGLDIPWNDHDSLDDQSSMSSTMNIRSLVNSWK